MPFSIDINDENGDQRKTKKKSQLSSATKTKCNIVVIIVMSHKFSLLYLLYTDENHATTQQFAQSSVRLFWSSLCLCVHVKPFGQHHFA